MLSWQTAKRVIQSERPLVMGILNVTPDSFSDGGRFDTVDAALHHAAQMIAEGADIVDVGGESTRPGSSRTSVDVEIARVAGVIEELAKRFDVPISVDTSRAAAARAAIDHGAEIINDISGLRFDAEVASVASKANAGLVLMHSRGEFAEMHTQPPVDDIVACVERDLAASIETARGRGVKDTQIVLDVGIGFGKTTAQNAELIRDHGKIREHFSGFAFLGGASRKSFIGKMLGDAPVNKRLGGSLIAAVAFVRNGASMVRVHDVAETVQAIKIARELGLFDTSVFQ